MKLLEWWRTFRANLNRMPSGYVSFSRTGVKVDIGRYLASPEGKRMLSDEKRLTERLIAEGKIIDKSKG